MTTPLFYLLLGLLIFMLGLHGMLTLQQLLRRIIAVNLMGGGCFLVMVALAARSEPIDPVLQALVVTGLVVAVSATAFALRLSSAAEQYREHKHASRRQSRP